jgi:AcrR family transcriptional regulator
MASGPPLADSFGGSREADLGSRSRRRGEGSELRADIIAAAALIEETGSEQSVTLREVARRIGIAAPSIYEHFPSREAIVYAVVDDCFSQFREALA